jgi:hypothetical protein
MTCPAKNPAIKPTTIQVSNPIIILQTFLCLTILLSSAQ